MYNVYLISCGEGEEKRYKIGYTKNDVSQRLKQLKTGSSEELMIEKVFSSKLGTKLESILHRQYKLQHLSGEWFRLNEKQVESFIDDCKRLETFLNEILTNSTFTNPKTILR
jgi:hypothetical protein